MSQDLLLREIAGLLEPDGDRSSTAKAIAEAVRKHGGWRSTGLYEVDWQRGMVSRASPGAPSPSEKP